MTLYCEQQMPEAIVRAFVAAWHGPDLDRVCALLGEDVAYHNIPMEPLNGKPAVESYLRSAGPFEESDWELLHIAAAGEHVLTERVDRMRVGGKSIALPLMGIFRVKDGLIREWRDYFDLAMYRSQIA
ncbi:limonene-1,2-epoxide hydrolase family protein [uncultured Erythrobacter sp.]|uniref:limonene-1,2-epoxide hydrolase family protein n=1 Tax=uncultured Erythrobacter sp. TaxID=263913 RepID=UPI0026253D2A|nr:limonene-1,2-epoxide hydrolase family protein [uncultured Erythrobacter sp.]